MTAKATYSVLVLFDDEVRIAAKACAAYRDLPEDASEEQLTESLRTLVHACIAALNGAENEDKVLLLGVKPVPSAKEPA